MQGTWVSQDTTLANVNSTLLTSTLGCLTQEEDAVPSSVQTATSQQLPCIASSVFVVPGLLPGGISNSNSSASGNASGSSASAAAAPQPGTIPNQRRHTPNPSTTQPTLSVDGHMVSLAAASSAASGAGSALGSFSRAWLWNVVPWAQRCALAALQRDDEATAPPTYRDGRPKERRRLEPKKLQDKGFEPAPSPPSVFTAEEWRALGAPGGVGVRAGRGLGLGAQRARVRLGRAGWGSGGNQGDRGGAREGEGSPSVSLEARAEGGKVLQQRKGEEQGGDESGGEQEAKVLRRAAGSDLPVREVLVLGGKQRPRLRQQEEHRQHSIDDGQQAPDLACKQGWDWKVREWNGGCFGKGSWELKTGMLGQVTEHRRQVA